MSDYGTPRSQSKELDRPGRSRSRPRSQSGRTRSRSGSRGQSRSQSPSESQSYSHTGSQYTYDTYDSRYSRSYSRSPSRSVSRTPSPARAPPVRVRRAGPGQAVDRLHISHARCHATHPCRLRGRGEAVTAALSAKRTGMSVLRRTSGRGPPTMNPYPRTRRPCPPRP